MTDAQADEVLSRRARAGDPEAFGRLVERYMRRAYVHAVGIVGSREDARDLLQETFVRAYRARHTLDPAQPFYGWLYQILRRLCFNFLRDTTTRARLLQHGAPDWLVVAERTPVDDLGIEAEREETRQRLATAITHLPAREREVLVLKEFDGLKYREIAELLGVPLGTVMSRLYAARKRLAEAMENYR